MRKTTVLLHNWMRHRVLAGKEQWPVSYSISALVMLIIYMVHDSLYSKGPWEKLSKQNRGSGYYKEINSNLCSMLDKVQKDPVASNRTYVVCSMSFSPHCIFTSVHLVENSD